MSILADRHGPAGTQQPVRQIRPEVWATSKVSLGLFDGRRPGIPLITHGRWFEI